MNWKTLNWKNCENPLTDEQLFQVEAKLGVLFPNDFRACVRECNGANVVQCDFDFLDSTGARMTSCIGAMLRFDVSAETSGVVNVWKGMGPHHHARIIPFAETGGGDLVCFDFRISDIDPHVVYYDHELGTFSEIADGFERFVEMLYVPKDVLGDSR